MNGKMKIAYFLFFFRIGKTFLMTLIKKKIKKLINSFKKCLMECFDALNGIIYIKKVSK